MNRPNQKWSRSHNKKKIRQGPRSRTRSPGGAPARARNATTPEHHFGSRVRGVETGDGARRVVARVSRAHAMAAEDGSLRHVVTRLVSLAVLVQYIAERDLYHLPKTQTRIDRVIPNTPYYRSAVGRRHPQPQPLASVTELNISNRRHYIR